MKRDDLSGKDGVQTLLDLALALDATRPPADNALCFLNGTGPLLSLVSAEAWMPDPAAGPRDLLCLGRWPSEGSNTAAHSARAEEVLGRWGLPPGYEEAFLTTRQEEDGFWKAAWHLPSDLRILVKGEGALPGKGLARLGPHVEHLDRTIRLSHKLMRLERAEGDLRSREQKQRQIIETSLDAVMLVDGHARVREWSSRAQELFGYLPEEAIGKRWYQVVLPEETWPMQDAFLERFQKHGEFPNDQYKALDIEVWKKSGTSFPAEVSFSHIEVAGEHHFVLYFRDITRRKQVESELIAAKQIAESAQEAEEAFLARMSHEIRTPLNVVTGIIELLGRQDHPEGTRDLVEVLGFASHHLMEIINDVLDLSKIKAGKMDIRPAPFSPRQWLGMVKRSAELMLRHRAVDFRLWLDPELPERIVADRKRINQVVLNLLQNAIKFTEKGFIEIRVGLSEEKGRPALRLELSDSGSGMSGRDLGRVFQAFSQGEHERSGAHAGSGLGLSIVRELVALMGGTVRASSEAGQGTQFLLRVPFEPVAAEDGPDDGKARSARREGPELLRLARTRILVVEDDPMNQQLLQRVLRDADAVPVLETDARAALRRTQTEKYDMVLMDLNLPGASGLDLARTLRAAADNPNRATPIIGLTAGAQGEERERALEAGMQDLLVKPFALSALLSTLDTWMGKNHSALNDRSTP